MSVGRLDSEPQMLEGGAPSPVQRRGMQSAIMTQSVGVLAQLAFQYGVILLYLRSMGITSTRALVYAAIPMFAYFLNVPAAYLADRYGKKRLAVPALIGSVAGFALLVAAGSLPAWMREPVAVFGIILFSLTQVFFLSSWYAVLKPIVPEAMRGRFFGRLRLAWTAIGILFMMAGAFVLSKDTPPATFQWLLLVVMLGQVLKVFFYRQIPELDPPMPAGATMGAALAKTLRMPGYAPFCSYVFLLSLFTAAGPAIFVLIEKDVLGFGDNMVMWLGNLVILGTLCGFFVGGKAVDRFGAKVMFLICHFAYGLILALFLLRGLVPANAVLWAAGVNLVYGVIYAVSSIAITTETFALMSRENGSLSGALAQSVYYGGAALSSMLAAAIIKVGLLREHWTVAGLELTVYDGVLLAYAAMVVLLVVTLGQVPSVVRKHQTIPGMR